MDARRRTEIFAGIFLLVSLVLLGLSLWILGSERQIFAKQEIFRTVFKDVKGLNSGAPVRLGGISIGRVSDISFSKDLTDPSVHVNLLINEEYLERIREDSLATIETQGLLGDKFLGISPGLTRQQLLPGSTIKTRESGDFGAVLGKAELVVQNTVEISDEVKKLLNELRTKSLNDLTTALNTFARLADDITKNDGLAHKLIYSKKDGDSILKNLSDTAQAVKDVTTEIKSGGGLINALIYGKSGDQTLTSFKESVEKIGSGAAALGDMLEKAKNGNGLLSSLFTGESGGDLNKAIKSLREMSQNLNSVSQSLATGEGTLGALIMDASVYDSLVEITQGSKDSTILRAAVRHALSSSKEEKEDSVKR